jgi:predicted esterase
MSRRSIFWLLSLCTILIVMIWTGRGQAWAVRLQNQESETVKMLGVVRSRSLAEVSGLAMARGEALRLWAHNDSGDAARLFLISSGGDLLMEVLLEGANHTDWEDMCAFEREGKRYLLVGDIGDNAARRSDCQLYLLPEPEFAAQADSKSREPKKEKVTAQTISFRFEDGPRNCESLGFDSTSNSLLLVEKLLGSAAEGTNAGVYQLDLGKRLGEKSASDSQPLVAKRIGELPWRNVTGLDLSDDGQRLFIRTYFEGYLLERDAEQSWQQRLEQPLPKAIRLPVEAQGEAVCFTGDASAVVLTSEFTFQPIWKLELAAESKKGPAAPEKIATQEPQPQQEIKKLILPGEAFECAGRPAFILWPKPELRSEPQPWIFYAPTLAPYPDEAEKWMHQQFLDAGVAVAGIDVGEAYGSPQARQLFEEFYAELTGKRGLAKRPCLLGRSRGGLWVSSWAADHPERFAGLAGIYPVFDWRTYPGVANAAPAYGLTPEALEQQAAELNPISRIERLAKAQLPVFIIHGDQDTVVPLKENSAAFAEAYKQAGAEAALQLVIATGQGHNMWEGFFRCQELVDFAIARAKAGAAEEKQPK